MPEELLDVKQVCEILKLSERTVFRLIKSGDLSGFKAGREWRFEVSDINDYIKKQRANSSATRAASV